MNMGIIEELEKVKKQALEVPTIQLIEMISVKERTDEEHLFLIRAKYCGSVRKYLLSIGDFKDVDMEEQQQNPAHCCIWCDKYLGFRGFCSKKCHDSAYSVEEEE